MNKIEQIIKYIKLWLNNIQKNYSNIIKIKIVEDDKNLYRVIFELENCMAELLVNESYFSPYENVSFEVVTIINDKPEYIYFWYQKDENIKNIIKSLDRGIDFIVKY